MLLRVYVQKEAEVYQLLKAADERSQIKTGSHDDTRCVVGINGVERTARDVRDIWVSVQRSHYDRKENVPGPLPNVEEIETAYVLDTYAHYGASSRSRSVLRVYTRLENDDTIELCEWGEDEVPPRDFLVFDIGALGYKDASRAPFVGTTLLEVLWYDKSSSIKVEVDLASLRSDRTLVSSFVLRGGEPSLTPGNAQVWITRNVSLAVEFLNIIRSFPAKYLHNYGADEQLLEVVRDQWWSMTSFGKLLSIFNVS